MGMWRSQVARNMLWGQELIKIQINPSVWATGEHTLWWMVLFMATVLQFTPLSQIFLFKGIVPPFHRLIFQFEWELCMHVVYHIPLWWMFLYKGRVLQLFSFLTCLAVASLLYDSHVYAFASVVCLMFIIWSK